MSDATRVVALSEATKLGLGDAAATLKAAQAYNNFLTADTTPAAADPATVKAATPAKTATSAKAATPAKTPAKKAVAATAEDAAAAEGLAAAAEAEAEADEAEEAAQADDGEIPESKEGVQAIIAKLLAANLRAEAIKLLKKFNAASATSVNEKDYAKFIAAGVALLPADEESEDLTA